MLSGGQSYSGAEAPSAVHLEGKKGDHEFAPQNTAYIFTYFLTVSSFCELSMVIEAQEIVRTIQGTRCVFILNFNSSDASDLMHVNFFLNPIISTTTNHYQGKKSDKF